MLYFKLAYRELRKNLKFSVFFTLTLAIGYSGFVAVDSLKNSIRVALYSRAKGILAADIGVGARRALTATEESSLSSLIPEGSENTRVFESYTMLAGTENSRLVEVKAIEDNYPFYGEIELEKQGVIKYGSRKDLFSEPRIWVFPELLLQLDLAVGDRIKIGDVEFTISDTILADSSGVGGGFSFAPPVYVAKNYFAETGLIRPGTTGYYSSLYKIPAGLDPNQLADSLNKNLTDPAIRVFTAENASEQVGRMLNYLSDYLGLAGLVAVFLTALGQVFLYRTYLVKRHRDIAILKSLGFKSFAIFKIYLYQIFILGALALLPMWALSYFLIPLMKTPARELVQMDFPLDFQVSTLFLLVGITTLSLLFVCGPLLIQALRTQPRELLYPLEARAHSPGWNKMALYLPATLSYFGLSIWLTKSIQVGSLFFALFLFSILALTLIGIAIGFALGKLRFKPVLLKLATRSLTREKFSSLAAFLTISLGVLLSNLIPIMEGGLKKEIAAPSHSEQPSLFLVDVQEEQLANLENFLTDNKLPVMQISPMIRARLSRVNDMNFEKGVRPGESMTREEENENRFRNRGFNLSYRAKLSSSEKIISSLNSVPDDANAISLETRFADRLKLSLGDKMVFDIQGVEFAGLVTSIRKVRWTSFQPNFFIQFDDGVLNDAPKTFLLTMGQMSLSEKSRAQTAIVKMFPNISIIDVSRVIERMMKIIAQMSLALKAMASFSIVVGLVILFSIASHQAHERRLEMNLFKILGASFFKIRTLFLLEFILIVGIATVFGSALSYAVSYILSVFIFDSAFAWRLDHTATVFAMMLICTWLITWRAISSVLNASPKELLSKT